MLQLVPIPVCAEHTQNPIVEAWVDPGRLRQAMDLFAGAHSGLQPDPALTRIEFILIDSPEGRPIVEAMQKDKASRVDQMKAERAPLPIEYADTDPAPRGDPN
jgi:hypothetical protein